MADKNIKIKVETDSSSVKDLNQNVNTLGLSFGKLVAGVASGQAVFHLAKEAFRAVVDTFKEGVRAAMDEERALTKLSFALNNNAAAVQRMTAFRNKLFETTLFSKDEITATISLGLELERTESQTKKMIQTAMGLSRVTGQDLHSVMIQLNGTFEGTIGRLGRLDGELKGLTKDQLENGMAVDLLNKKFGKLATEGMDTAEGRVIQAKKNWKELWEEIGKNVLPIIGRTATGISALLGDLDAKIQNIKDNIEYYQKILDNTTTPDLDSEGARIEVAELKQELKGLQQEKYFKDLIQEIKDTGSELDELRKKAKPGGAPAGKETAEDRQAKIQKTLDDAQAKLDKEHKREAKESQRIIDEQLKQQEKVKKIFEDSARSLKTLDQNYKLLGGDIDGLNKSKVSVLESELKSLLEAGFSPNSKAIQDLVKQIKDLKPALTEADLAFLNVFKDLDKGISTLDKTFNLLGGDTRDLINNKIGLMETALQNLLVQGVKPTDLAVQHLVERIKELKKELASLPPEKMEKLPTTSKPPKSKTEEDDAKAYEEGQQNLQDYENAAISAAENIAQNVVGSIFESMISENEKALQKTLDQIDKMTTKSEQNLQKLNQKRFISDAEYQRRKEKLDKEKEAKETAAKKEAAKKNKKYAEEQALINAFLGAGAALAKIPWGWDNVVAAALTLAMGLADVAIIASKPLEYKKGGVVPSFAAGGTTSSFGDPTGMPAILHPNEGVLNSNAMNNLGGAPVINALNAGTTINQSTQLHPDTINAIVTGINNKKTYVVESDITTVQNRTQVLQSRSTF